MDPKVKEAIFRAVEKETFAQALNMELVDLELGYSAVEMTYDPSAMNNIYDRAHGGAIFGLIDEILPEPLGAAHRDPDAAAEVIRNAILKHLDDIDQLDIDQLLDQRQQRLASFGEFRET